MKKFIVFSGLLIALSAGFVLAQGPTGRIGILCPYSLLTCIRLRLFVGKTESVQPRLIPSGKEPCTREGQMILPSEKDGSPASNKPLRLGVCANGNKYTTGCDREGSPDSLRQCGCWINGRYRSDLTEGQCKAVACR